MSEMHEQQLTLALPLHPQDEMECRRCDVHCDKVVYPGACLSRSCPFVYSYEAWGHTYVGCMQKIYEIESDLYILLAAGRQRVDGADSDPAEGDAQPVQRAVAVPCGRRRRARRELQVEGGVARGADRRGAAALQPLDPRRQGGDLLDGLRVLDVRAQI